MGGQGRDGGLMSTPTRHVLRPRRGVERRVLIGYDPRARRGTDIGAIRRVAWRDYVPITPDGRGLPSRPLIAEAVDALLAARSAPGPGPIVAFDPERHILLRDQAHKRRIHADSEFDEYLAAVSAEQYLPGEPTRMRVFRVRIPEWPGVPRSPLALVFSLGGDGGGMWWDRVRWTGVHWAVERDFWTERATSVIARRMVPNTDMPDRLTRQTEELEMSVSGNPALVSEAVLALRDWPHQGVSRWTALRAEHTLSKQRGYVTSVIAEPSE